MNKVQSIFLAVVAVVAGYYFIQKNISNPGSNKPNNNVQEDSRKYRPTELDDKAIPTPEDNSNRADDALNRRVSRLIYTKHARCRMDCRHIDESEVKEILRDGTINYTKSDLADRRGPKYAVEGITHDSQRVRIVFAQDADGTAVVTVIDLDSELDCDCN